MLDLLDRTALNFRCKDYDRQVALEKSIYQFYLRNADLSIQKLADEMNITKSRMTGIISTGLSEDWANVNNNN
jgi:hypothetical protein